MTNLVIYRGANRFREAAIIQGSWDGLLLSSRVLTPGATWGPIISSTSEANLPAMRIFSISSADFMVTLILVCFLAKLSELKKF